MLVIIILLGTWDFVNENENTEFIEGNYVFKDNIVSTLINISIKNNSDTAMKLYSLFPGNRDVLLNNTKVSIVNKANYCDSTNNGVWIKYRGNRLF